MTDAIGKGRTQATPCPPDGYAPGHKAVSPFVLAEESRAAGGDGTPEDGARRRIEALAEARARRDEAGRTPEAQAFNQALHAVRKGLKRRTDTADIDPFQAMARGLVTEGKHLRALAPTPQIGLMAVAYRKRAALLSSRQVAALGVYHQAWMGSFADRGVVDPERVRVDGGGRGDAGWAMAKALESLREFRRLRNAVGDPLALALIDQVVLLDQDIASHHDARTALVQKDNAKAAVRVTMLVSGADAMARQLWG